MAMRVHLLASLGGDPADLQRRCNMETEEIGDWHVGLQSVWRLGTEAADWQVVLHSRAHRCLALRATTLDDALVSVRAYHAGRLLFAHDQRFGGPDGDFLEALYEDCAWGEKDEDQLEPDVPPLDEPWPEHVRGRLANRAEGDPRLLLLLAEGLSPTTAVERFAEHRAQELAEACRSADAQPNEDLLRAVLAGTFDLRAVPLQLDGWAEVPELLAGLGLPGLRLWLGEQRAEEEEDGDPAAADAGPRAPGLSRVRLGCAVASSALVAGIAIGAWLGAGDGSVSGGIGGGLAGLAVTVTLLVLLAVARIALGLWRLKKAVVGDRDWSEDTDPLPLRARIRSETLLSDYRDLAYALDRAPAGGLFGALLGAESLPQDPAGLQLVQWLRTGADVSDVALKVSLLRDDVLDAAVDGRSLDAFGERFDGLI
jgi:hypothetical protein